MTALTIIKPQQDIIIHYGQTEKKPGCFPDLQYALTRMGNHVAKLNSTVETEERHTKNQYSNILKNFLLWLGDDLPTAPVVEEYIASLSNQKLSPATINTYLAPIRRFCKFLSRQPIDADLSESEFRRLSQEKDQVAEAAVIEGVKQRTRSTEARLDQFHWRSGAEILTILHTINRDSLEGRRDYALMVLAFNSALRVNELARITLVNFKRHSEDTVLIVNLRGKGGQIGSIPLPIHVYRIVESYVKAFNETLPKGDERRIKDVEPIWRALKAHSGEIFPDLARNKKMSRSGVARIIERRSRAAGLAMNAHDTRRSAIAYMRSIGMEPAHIQKVSRHASLDMVTKYIGEEIDWDKFNHALKPGAIQLA